MKISFWRLLALSLFSCICLSLLCPAVSFASGDKATCIEGQTPDCKGVCGGDAVLDVCYVCDGPGLNNDGCCGTDTKDCKGVCGGTAQDLQCGCNIPPNADGCCNGLRDIGCGCGVDPCPDKCIYVAAWADWSGFWGSGGSGNSLHNRSKQYTYQQGANVPGCFTNKFQSQCMNGKNTGKRAYYGGCKGGAGYYYGGAYSHLDLANFIGVPAHKRNPSFCKSFNFWSGCGHAYTNWYMDESCKYHEPAQNTKLCGFAGVSWSPISLVWDETHSLTQGMTVVEFSLTADSAHGYSLWKASDVAPLLVYDPEHTGKVHSAKQLFGNVAFGGVTKTVADFESDKQREPWSNGYDALELLDSNHDGKVSGSELAPVSLWFDRNRDAKVDEGELRTALQEGITTLFYKDAVRAEGSDDMTLSIGFERISNGKKIVGRSIDWFTKVFESKHEAMLALSAEFQNKNQDTIVAGDSVKADYFAKSVPFESRSYVSWPHDTANFKPHVAKNHSSDVSGYWAWIMNDNSGEKHPGFFALEHQSDGVVLGYSIIESILAKNSQDLRSNVSILPAKGFVEVGEEGKVFKFEVYDRKSGSTAVSTARLSPDGKTLHGTTRQSLSAERDGVVSTASIDYEWSAFKFMPGEDDGREAMALLK